MVWPPTMSSRNKHGGNAALKWCYQKNLTCDLIEYNHTIITEFKGHGAKTVVTSAS
jgi:hypothetical protein